MTSPVRTFYRCLVAMDSRESLEYNLAASSDSYRNLVGHGEARFCEWVYTGLERQTIYRELLNGVLRPSDVNQLARKVGCTLHDSWDLERRLRCVLGAMGIRGPTVPPPLQDGLDVLRRVHRWLCAHAEGRSEQSFQDFGPQGPAGACRQGLERMLKVILCFLWEHYRPLMTEIMTEGKHDFSPGSRHDTPEKWLTKIDAGTANFLLQALHTELNDSAERPRYLHEAKPLWKNAFHRTRTLTDALNGMVHDRLISDPNEAQRLCKALGDLLQLTEGPVAEIRVPKVIQFHRRYQDGSHRDIVHYEGLDASGKHISFWEASQEYELHRPYMYLAATNPSAIDMLCTPMWEDFLLTPAAKGAIQ